jgi:ABC-type transport system substrate-binding protein
VHQDITEIQTPDEHTVIFKLGKPKASMELHFVSPFNCVYSAAGLRKDPDYPAKRVMGTGAFQFVEYVKGSHWTAKRFDGLAKGTFDAAVQNISDLAGDPTARFNTLLSKYVSSIAYSRHTDKKIDEMYETSRGR